MFNNVYDNVSGNASDNILDYASNTVCQDVSDNVLNASSIHTTDVNVICITNRKLYKEMYFLKNNFLGNNFPEDFLLHIEKIAKCHPAAIILREKDLTEQEYKELATKVLAICKKYNTPCILHYFVRVAISLKAKAIHLPLPMFLQMKEEEKKHFDTIGVSCHSVEEAKLAEDSGCSYITAGHIFETDCKKGLAGRGVEFLSEVCKWVKIPVYALGGIDADKVNEVLKAGAYGVCVMSGAMVCTEPQQYLDELSYKNSSEVAFDTLLNTEECKEMKFNKNMLLLYAVTDRAWTGRQSLYEQVEEALQGGVTLVQLREKNLDEKTFVEEALTIKQLCHKYQVPLIINDNLEVALKVGADGIHVGIEDMTVSKIREIVGEDFIIGATAKTVEQAHIAEKSGANYLGVGAVFSSSTKENAIEITKEQLQEICKSVAIPAVAIGGITADNMWKIKGAGMEGIAVVSAIFGADDICSTTSQLKEKVKYILG